MRQFLVFTFISAILPAHAWGAACCGGSSSFPSIITGAQRAFVSGSVSYSNVQARALPETGIRFWSQEEQLETRVLKIDGALLMSERWQVGLGLPLQWRQIRYPSGLQEQDSRLQDVQLQTSYELLQERLFSRWKPRGYLTFKLNVPTGRSAEDSLSQSRLADVSGLGAWGLGAQLSLIKEFRRWDALASLSADHFFASSLKGGGSAGSFDVYTASAGAGWSFLKGAARVGGLLRPYYRTSKTIRPLGGSRPVRTSYELYWDASATASYRFGDHVSCTLIFTDQTLVGPVENSTLARSVTFQVLRNWSL